MLQNIRHKPGLSWANQNRMEDRPALGALQFHPEGTPGRLGHHGQCSGKLRRWGASWDPVGVLLSGTRGSDRTLAGLPSHPVHTSVSPARSPESRGLMISGTDTACLAEAKWDLFIKGFNKISLLALLTFPLLSPLLPHPCLSLSHIHTHTDTYTHRL